MSTGIEYDDILSLARNESARAGHFFIGVEHLFIALTKLKGGATASILEAHGIAPRFARYMVRQELGQGDNRRFWPGFRETPRMQTVVRQAKELAAANGRMYPVERDLFLAILQEGDSLPYRVLAGIGADFEQLAEAIGTWSADTHVETPNVPVKVADDLELDSLEIEVLQQMFRAHAQVVIERQLDAGYTGARVLVATPIRADGRADASVVVKIDDRQSILYEKQRYNDFVQHTLPPMSARVVDNPIVPDRSPLGGLKYTFVRSSIQSAPVDLAMYARENEPEALSDLLWSLYRFFGETWWSQRQPYRFGVWQEYEMVLPPAIVVEVSPGLSAPRRKLTPLGQWSRRGRFAHREVVALEGFTVEDFYPDRNAIQLTSGAGPDAANRAGKIEVRGIKLPSAELYRGGLADRLVGQVLYTRDDLLRQQATRLDPHFDLDSDRLPEHVSFPVQLPNPLMRYLNLLQRRLSGSLSIIHGDLHLRNVLVGPGGNAWLIDFATTREGHTLFDWAVLETSMLAEVIAPAIETDYWDDIWPVIALLADTGASLNPPAGRLPVERALHSIATIRRIVAECLADPDDWSEYFVALALCTMRTLRWTAIPLKGRRLLFLVSALAMASATVRDATSPSSPDIDATDINLKP